MRRFTPDVEEYSIDEAFSDITGMRRALHSSYEAIALQMKKTIERELGITVSVGLSITKVLAKVASKHQKPSGMTVIKGRDIAQYLSNLPVEKIWGSGRPRPTIWPSWASATALAFARTAGKNRAGKIHQAGSGNLAGIARRFGLSGDI